MAVSTQKLRYQFPECIVGGVTSTWIVTGRRPKCDYSMGKTTRVRILAGGPKYPKGYIDLKVHWDLRDFFIAIAAVMHHWGYEFRESSGGTVSCRKITGSSKRTSPHAHGVAGDWNPSENRYRRQVGPVQWGRQTDMPIEMIEAIEAIRSLDGKRVVQWGGRWTNIKDPMHFNPKQGRISVKNGRIDWSTVVGIEAYRVWAKAPVPITPPSQEDDYMLPLKYGDGFKQPPNDSEYDGTDRSHRQEDVKLLQRRVGASVDGYYGEGTGQAAGVYLGQSGTELRTIGDEEWDAIELKYFGRGGTPGHVHEVPSVTTGREISA